MDAHQHAEHGFRGVTLSVKKLHTIELINSIFKDTVVDGRPILGFVGRELQVWKRNEEQMCVNTYWKMSNFELVQTVKSFKSFKSFKGFKGFREEDILFKPQKVSRN